MTTCRHGFVGNGKAVHLISERGQPLCGAGKSTLAHSAHRARVRYTDIQVVTCKKCRKYADAMSWYGSATGHTQGDDR